MGLIASLPPDLAADRPPWPGPAAPRVTRKVTFTSLTRAQRADVARLYATGMPVRDICARFNIPKNTVIRLRKQAGVPQLQRGRDEPQGHEAEAMYASGTSPMAIACGDSPPGRLRQPEAPGEQPPPQKGAPAKDVAATHKTSLAEEARPADCIRRSSLKQSPPRMEAQCLRTLGRRGV